MHGWKAALISNIRRKKTNISAGLRMLLLRMLLVLLRPVGELRELLPGALVAARAATRRIPGTLSASPSLVLHTRLQAQFFTKCCRAQRDATSAST